MNSVRALRNLIWVVPAFWITTAIGFDQSTPLDLNDGWQVSAANDAGFDTEKLDTIGADLAADHYPNAHVVLVEHDGKLVFEQYLSGKDQNWGSPIGKVTFGPEVKHDLRSITKSVTALLLGIALQEFRDGNFEQALSESIMTYFPEHQGKVTEGAEAITLHHVLTMTDGLDWNEMQVPYSNQQNDEIQLYDQSNPFLYVLNKSIRTQPGKAWYYNGGTTMLLAGVIENLSGKTLRSYAEQALFSPLGIDDYEWRGDGIWQKGLPSAASGLRLTGRDLAKIGSLMLHEGKWNGQQVAPAEWVRLSSMRHTEQTNSEWSKRGIYGYGYQWWHGNFPPKWVGEKLITGVGYGGQKLFVIPGRNMVVTIFAGNYGLGNWDMTENLLHDILAAAP